jgi:hypothetical protein
VLLNNQWQIVHAYSGRKHAKKYGSKKLSKNEEELDNQGTTFSCHGMKGTFVFD